MKRFLCTFLSIVMIFSIGISVSGEEWNNPFKDVEEGEWYYEPISFVAERNLLLGMADDVFGVNVNMTRAMFVTVLGRLNGAPNEKNEPTVFTDVPVGEWYSGYVKWAAANGIVFGTSKTTFAPDAPISRQDMCVITKRYLSYAGLSAEQIREAVPFDDQKDIADYAKDAVTALQKAGVINGMGTKFEPTGLSTRAQVAVVIKKITQIASGELTVINISLEEPPEKDPGTPVVPAMAAPTYETGSYTVDTVWEAEYIRPMTDRFVYTENYMVTVKVTASAGKTITDSTSVFLNGVKLEKGYVIENNVITFARKYLLSGSSWHY